LSNSYSGSPLIYAWLLLGINTKFVQKANCYAVWECRELA
jgi:hypothetical protein